uniref:L1 transposable element RRM domain-containing protein n=1 Tax=Pundamilia nyererei TaxID=303518 RepID=A0A3B4F3U4_9CICH
MPRGKINNTQATSLTAMVEAPDGADARCSSQDGVVAELTSIRALLEQVVQDMMAVKGGIESLKEAVNSLGARVDKTETRISRLEDEEAKASSISKNLKIQNQRLQEKVTALEGFSRRQNIRISGIREGTEGRNLEDCAKNLLSEALDIEMGDWYEIDRIHRVGPAPPMPTADSRPRHIIVRFLRHKAKMSVLAAARKKKQIVWKGMRVCFFQDYAQEVQEKRKKFDEVRRLLQQHNIGYSLRFPAVMTFSVDNQISRSLKTAHAAPREGSVEQIN